MRFDPKNEVKTIFSDKSKVHLQKRPFCTDIEAINNIFLDVVWQKHIAYYRNIP